MRRIVVPAARFSAVGGTCAPAPSSIAPGNACTIIHGFAPTQPGTFAQSLVPISDVGTATFDLDGSAVGSPRELPTQSAYAASH